ncbi:Uma2 family endonuclease [Streptomyces marispadix]|nr:Uma2 family endonuclease [Streptomyces marispadix]
MLERPTPIETPDGPPDFEALCRTLLSMEVPDGYRAEIIRGSIVVSPWSRAFYLSVMRSVRRQLEPHAPEGQIIDAAPFLFSFPHQERAYGPDVYAAEERAFQSHDRYVDGEALSLAVELTSAATRKADLEDKVTVYGMAQVPVYLLLDMQEESATVYWAPSAKGYTSHLTVPFGKSLHVPAPFDCELDTTGFGAPAEREDGQKGAGGQPEAG